MFDSTNLNLILMWLKTQRYLVQMGKNIAYRCVISYYKQIEIDKGDKTMIRTQQHTKLNTTVKEIQQLNLIFLHTHTLLSSTVLLNKGISLHHGKTQMSLKFTKRKTNHYHAINALYRF